MKMKHPPMEKENKLQEALLKKGWTVYELAQKTDYSTAHLYGIIKIKHAASWECARRIAWFLEVNMYDIFRGKSKYNADHYWIRKNYGEDRKCEECKAENKEGIYYDWANISGHYLRERSDWRRLCRPCHIVYDRNKKERKLKYVNTSW